MHLLSYRKILRDILTPTDNQTDAQLKSLYKRLMRSSTRPEFAQRYAACRLCDVIRNKPTKADREKSIKKYMCHLAHSASLLYSVKDNGTADALMICVEYLHYYLTTNAVIFQ